MLAVNLPMPIAETLQKRIRPALAGAEVVNSRSDIAVLVSSCDNYRDVWSAFFTLFFRYWPDCPLPVYLVSNFESYPDLRVKTILVGKDKSWSSSFASGLRKIREPLVIFMMEDYLLDRRADTERILRLAKYMKSKGAACLRLFPVPGPDHPCGDNPEVGEILKGTDYRLSTQAAIWKRKTLLQLLRWGETPWELELLGSRRTDALEAPFLSIRRDLPAGPPLSYFCTAVVAGRWRADAVRLCEREGIRVDLNVRPLERQEPSLPMLQQRKRTLAEKAVRRLWRRP